MLSAGVVAVLLLAVTGAAIRGRFSWRRLLVSVGVLEALGLVLLGLPGAAFLETLDPVMQRSGRHPITGDAAWPAAIAMSVVWPVALVPAYLLARSLRSGNVLRGFAALGVLLVMSSLVGVLIYIVAT